MGYLPLENFQYTITRLLNILLNHLYIYFFLPPLCFLGIFTAKLHHNSSLIAITSMFKNLISKSKNSQRNICFHTHKTEERCCLSVLKGTSWGGLGFWYKWLWRMATSRWRETLEQADDLLQICGNKRIDGQTLLIPNLEIPERLDQMAGEEVMSLTGLLPLWLSVWWVAENKWIN